MQVSITVLMSGALCQCTLSKELLLWLCSALGWWVSTCDLHPLPGPSLQFPSRRVPKGWDIARSSWLRRLPSLWEPHLSTVHFLRQMVNICHFRQSCKVGAEAVREKIAFPQQQAASLWRLQSGLWSSLSKPPGLQLQLTVPSGSGSEERALYLETEQIAPDTRY